MATLTTTNRDYLIDNLKFLLISTVVIGHFFEPYITQSAFFKAVFVCIYSFHMPMFVFISGYLSKSTPINFNKIVTTLLIPYIVFSLLWYIRECVHTKTPYFDISSPPFHLWYLLSLLSWKLLLPLVQSIKHHIFITFIISLLVGFSPLIGHTMSLSRTLALFPFFVIGTACSSNTLYAIHSKKYLAVFGVLLLIAIAYAVTHYSFNWRIVSWDEAYHLAGYSNKGGFLARLLLMLISLLIGISIIVITPSTKTFFTLLGARTLTVYIIHGFLVRSFAIRYPLWGTNIITDGIIIIFPLLLIYLLSLPIITKLYNRTFNFISKKIISPPHAGTIQ
jgi:fucose 4-O-acetylase-like acetyltransferase